MLNFSDSKKILELTESQVEAIVHAHLNNQSVCGPIEIKEVDDAIEVFERSFDKVSGLLQKGSLPVHQLVRHKVCRKVKCVYICI